MIKINWFNFADCELKQKKLEQAIESVLSEYDIDQVQLDVSVVGADKMIELNQRFLDRQGVTDVLSFPQYSESNGAATPVPDQELRHLGEIVICCPVAKQEAKDSGNSITDQLSFYIEHGLMHLLGYHHQ